MATLRVLLYTDGWMSTVSAIGIASSRLQLTITNSTQLCTPPAAGKFDAVIITDEFFAGLRAARALPEELRARTLVLWPAKGRSSEEPYRQLGCSRFATRSPVIRGTPVEEFLVEMARTREGAHG